ncbi:MAG: GNAT family N-acetyltransferase [Chloroflexaceae bacterium]|nr:GNAT family N-acetyltransferase [Chloroflexaceae bacterium]
MSSNIMINNIPYSTKIASHIDSTMVQVHISHATVTDIDACKTIADQHRNVLGFLTRAVFTEAAERQRLLVAAIDGQIVGFVRFNHRVRGTETAIYDICTNRQIQGRGVGRALVVALAAECRQCHRETIALRCPEGSPANNFYTHMGFQQEAVEKGKHRRLIVWRLHIKTVL